MPIPVYIKEGDLEFDSDPERIPWSLLMEYVHNCYWSPNRSLEVMQDAVRNSFFLACYDKGQLAGYCRMVTDYTTFGWLCDVYVHHPWRGQGISKRLMELITTHPEFSRMKRILLITKDAHGLYKQFGYETLTEPDKWMVRDQRNSMRV
ncbi:MAG TPA: GNAT family N-acetyltransferase [Bellilinea sp.]|nr:GNAT family N-acetyltransferase [Bellilinea sp.]